MNIDKEKIIRWIDGLMEFALLFLIFTLPFSKSLLEGAFITLLSLWVIKRLVCYSRGASLITAFKPVSTEPGPAIGVFIFIGFLSTLASVSFYLSLEGFFCKLFEWVMLYFIVTELLTERKQLIRVLAVFFISMIVISADGIFQMITGTDLLRGRPIFGCRISSSFHNPNEFAGWLVVMIPVALSFAYCGGSTWSDVFLKFKWVRYLIRPLLWILLALLIFCLIFTYTRGAWVAVLISIIFLGILKSKKLIVCFLIVLMFMPFVLPESVKERTSSMLKIQEDPNKRGDLWREAVNVIEDFPVIGSGLNTYAFIAPRYGSGQYPHNSYLHMAAEMGILGLGVFVWMLIVLFRAAIKSIKKIDDELYNITLTGLLSGLFGFLIQSFTDTNIYSLQLSILMWLIMGLTVAVRKIASEQ